MFLLQKEYKNLARHTRSYLLLLAAFFIPFAVFYLLFGFTGRIIQSQIDDTGKEKYKVAWVVKGEQAADLRKKLERHLQIELIDSLAEDRLEDALLKDSISVGIIIDEKFDSAIIQQKKAEIVLYLNGNSSGAEIVEKVINTYRKELIKKNIAASSMPEGIVNPIELTENNMRTMQDMLDDAYSILNMAIATLLSLLLLIFGAVGTTYALRRVFWEERTSGTLAWALATTVSYRHFFRAKIITTAIFSWKMMFLALLGFLLALNVPQQGLMEGLMKQLRELLSWQSFILLSVSAIPLSMLFAGFWSFLGFGLKAAWAIFVKRISFLLLILIFIVGGSISVSLGYGNAFIPFFNIPLLCKALVLGKYEFVLLVSTWVATTVFAIGLNLLALRKFRG